ncbi:hypothetical protein C8R44DRAFT_740778 [Mycena epipterygia]|nr:hypothetical protein C8R44DRAFT_740778 [Mycena epipterygia]
MHRIPRSSAILSPVRGMPAELLGEIFLWTLPPADIDDTRRRWSFNAKESPWVLTHISGRWRAVALSTPSLWSLIITNLARMSANPLAMVKTQIQRAHIFDFIRAPALTEIAIYVEEEDEDDSLAHLEPLVARPESTHVLPKHPFITELAIVINEWARYDATNAFISHLTIPALAATAAFTPQLSAMYVGCHDDSCIDYALYLKMLQSRWKVDGCALKSAALLINSGPTPDATTLSGLNLLRHDGLDLMLLEGKEASDFMDDLIYIRRRWK